MKMGSCTFNTVGNPRLVRCKHGGMDPCVVHAPLLAMMWVYAVEMIIFRLLN